MPSMVALVEGIEAMMKGMYKFKLLQYIRLQNWPATLTELDL